LLEAFGASGPGALAGSLGVAVNDTSGQVYASGSEGAVGIFGSLGQTAVLAEVLVGSAPSSVGESAATVAGTVDPDGVQIASCVFEYGTTDTYGQSVPCEQSPAQIGAGEGPVRVSATLGGLAPLATYHYRLSAANANGSNETGGELFTTLGPAGVGESATCPNPGHSGLSERLPDCRAYELLTPPDKQDADDMFGEASEKVAAGTDTSETGYPDEDPAEEGDKFFLTTSAAFGENAAAGNNGYVFSRGPSRWEETSLASPGGGAQSIPGDPIFSPDFSHVAIFDEFGSEGNKAAIREAGLVGPPGGLPPGGGPYPTTLFDLPIEGQAHGKLVGASADFGRVFFQSTEHGFAAPAAEQVAGSNALYEYADGHDSLVNVAGDGALTNACGAFSPAVDIAVGGYAHAVSADGSHVFFLSPDETDSSCFEEFAPFSVSDFTGTAPQLYVRFDGRTIEVSAPEGGSEPPTGVGPQPVAFAGASADGSRVFFVTRGELTPDDAGNHDPELYEYNVETETLTRVSSGDSGSAVGNVGWVVPSEDGSTVYFTATGQLAPGARALSAAQNEQERAEQEYNLYRYDTATATTTYIATVSGDDFNGVEGGGIRQLNIRNPINVRSDWETTPDGQYLLFDAVEDLTGYNPSDPTGHCPGEITGLGEHVGSGCAEVYRYDAQTGGLACVSCNPSGAAPSANALFDGNTNYREVRAISNNGAYVFFDTSEALVSAATNEKVNVYEWHEGALSLISSGQSSSNDFFLGTDASGADVFFGTHARLVSEDTDSAGDLYDARIDGGFPPPQGSAACEGDACQSPPPLPLFQTPATLTLASSGNIAAAAGGRATDQKKTVTKKATKCKKGFVKNKKGKCVQKPKKKSKAKKSDRASNNRRTSR
jgi:hypothetical protein